MSVQDVLILAASLLERADLEKELGEKTTGLSQDAEALLKCYNVIENEVALDYFPLKKRERLHAEGGTLSYSAFSSAPVQIHAVTDETGRAVNFSAFPLALVLPKECGDVEVTYSYSPAKKQAGEETEFGERIPERLLAYGVASEHCLSNHRYAEGKLWGERYRDALKAAGILRRPLFLPSRRWI